MARSLKKGPFADGYLLKKIDAMNADNKKDVIKTWSRRSTIFPSFVGHTIAVYETKETDGCQSLLFGIRRLPIFPGRHQPSIFGV